MKLNPDAVEQVQAILEAAKQAHKVTRARLHGHPDAEDIAQDVVVKMLIATRDDKFNPTRPDRNGWVSLVTKRTLSDARKKAVRRKTDLAADPDAQVKDLPEKIERAEMLSRLLLDPSFSDDERQVIRLWLSTGKTCAEIADELGRSSQAVHADLRRAKHKLRQLLELELGVSA